MADDLPLGRWRGDFGAAYTKRNAADEIKCQRAARAFASIFSHIDGAMPRSILEVGANVGINLRAIKRICDATLSAVEPFAGARTILVEDGVVPAESVFDAIASSLPFASNSIELVFTHGVLIHVPEEDFEKSCREIYRVSSRYVLTMEYFSPSTVKVPYRGYDDMLFKRDYGGVWLDMFPDLKHVANGFFWKRTTGLDNVNWWLLQK